MKLKSEWVLPAPPKDTQSVWHPVVRLGRHVPFGYEQDPNDLDVLLPIPLELELLEKAKLHIKKYPLREVAHWLSKESGRTISHEGLRKRINLESKRQRDAVNARLYAERAKEAAEKAEKLSKRIGGSETRDQP